MTGDRIYREKEDVNYFNKLASINVTEHVEKKGQFTYLSWPFAVAQLANLHPDSKWKIKKYKDDAGHKVPYLKTELGFFVEVSVTINGVKRTQIHPVLNHLNKPVAKPNPFEINTSIQRCLVKAIALHGLGLYIYAGEDLPMVDTPHHTPEQKATFDLLFKENRAIEFYEFVSDLDPEIRATLHGSFDKDKMKNKKAANDLENGGSEMIDTVVKSLNDYSDSMDILGIKETVSELTKPEKGIIWIRLDEMVKSRIKQALETDESAPEEKTANEGVTE